MNKQSGTTFHTITELAQAVKVDMKTAYRWVNTGIVEHSCYVGSRAVFTPDEFEAAKKIGLERKAALRIMNRTG